MALIALSPPASSLLLDPAALRTRLAGAGIAVSADDAASLAAMASSETAAVLGYDPAYQPWRQTYGSTSGPYLYLTPRPVRALATVLNGAGTTLGATSYRFEGQRLARGAYGWQSSGTWPLDGLGGDVTRPDWSVDFCAGWWLPGWDPEDNAEEIPALDGAIASYAFEVARAIHFGPGSAFAADGATVQLAGITATLKKAGARPESSPYLVRPTAGVLRWRAPVV